MEAATGAVALNDGRRIPQLGFGTYKISPGDTAAAVRAALEAGYRHIDTATMYGNEVEVGQAIRDSGLPREDVWITTKLNNDSHGHAAALAAGRRSARLLGVEYIDLYLIHWPLPSLDRYVETWLALEQLQHEGTAASVGVSNFQLAHLRRLAQESDVTPAVNQVELHPYLAQRPLRDYHAAHGIVTEAWSPLARGGALLADPTIAAIAATHEASPAQVVLAWHRAAGTVAIPKSVHPDRIRANLASAGVALNPADRAAIDALDRDGRVGSDPDRVSPDPTSRGR